MYSRPTPPVRPKRPPPPPNTLDPADNPSVVIKVKFYQCESGFGIWLFWNDFHKSWEKMFFFSFHVVTLFLLFSKAPSTESIKSWNCAAAENLLSKVRRGSEVTLEEEDEFDPFDTKVRKSQTENNACFHLSDFFPRSLTRRKRKTRKRRKLILLR